MNNLYKLPIIILSSLSFATYAKVIEIKNHVHTPVVVRIYCTNSKTQLKTLLIDANKNKMYSTCKSATNLSIEAWVKDQENTIITCHKGTATAASSRYTVSKKAHVDGDYAIACSPV